MFKFHSLAKPTSVSQELLKAKGNAGLSKRRKRKREGLQSRSLRFEALQDRRMLAVTGLGGVQVTVAETYRDFVFEVAGTIKGTNTAEGYLDTYSGKLTNGEGVAKFTSPSVGTATGTGTVNIIGRDNSGPYTREFEGAGSTSINNGQLSNFSFDPSLAGVTPQGTFDPNTWKANVTWSGSSDGVNITGSFAGQVTQKLPKPDFTATATFDDSAATSSNATVGQRADKVKATVTIKVTGQHLHTSSMSDEVTTVRLFLDDPASGGTELVTPIPIHWNTNEVKLELTHFLNRKNASRSFYVTVDESNKVQELSETNNRIAISIPYDLAATGLGWQSNGSVLGSYTISAYGLNNSTPGSSHAKLVFADRTSRPLDADPTSSTIFDPISLAPISPLSKPAGSEGDFLLPSLPLTFRPEGATQILLLVDDSVVPPNNESDESNNSASLKLTELSLRASSFANGQVKLTVNVSAAPTPFDTTVEIYWASGATTDSKLLSRAASRPLPKNSFGDIAIATPISALGSAPKDATHLVVVLDPPNSKQRFGKILEPIEANEYVLGTAPKAIKLSNSSVKEELRITTVVGRLTVTTKGLPDDVAFSLVSGTGATDNSKFSINNKGELLTKSSFDFEKTKSLSIRVKASNSLGLYTESAFTINVTNVNEVPTSISVSNLKIMENLPKNTTVGKIVGKDPDAGSKLTYSIVPIPGKTDHTKFKIVGDKLLATTSFNFEERKSYSLQIQVRDQFGLFIRKQFRVDVGNRPNA